MTIVKRSSTMFKPNSSEKGLHLYEPSRSKLNEYLEIAHTLKIKHIFIYHSTPLRLDKKHLLLIKNSNNVVATSLNFNYA